MNASKSITVRLDEETTAKLEALIARANDPEHLHPVFRGGATTASDIIRSAISFLHAHEGLGI